MLVLGIANLVSPRRAVLAAPLSLLPILVLPQSTPATTGRSSVRDGMNAFTAGRVEESVCLPGEMAALDTV